MSDPKNFDETDAMESRVEDGADAAATADDVVTQAEEVGEVVDVIDEADTAEDLAEGEASDIDVAEEATEQAEEPESAADSADEIVESVEDAQDDAVADDQPQDALEPEAPADAEPTVSEGADKASGPKSAIGMGDLIIVSILSLIMALLLAFAVTTLSSSAAAVTVNGTAISEDEVTEYIEGIRASQQLTDDDAWGNWLVSNGYTPETLREAVANSFAARELVNQAVAEQGIVVTDEEVETIISQSAAQLGGEEALEKALADQGATLNEYRENVKLSLAEQALAEKVAGDVEVPDEEVIEIIRMYAPDEVDENTTSLDGVDENMVNSVKEMLRTQKISEAFSAWMTDYQSKAEIKIGDMPEGLPYAVDVSKYSGQTATAVPDTAANGEAANGEAANGEDAAAKSASSEAESAK